MAVLVWFIDLLWSALILWVTDSPERTFVMGTAFGVTTSAFVGTILWRFLVEEE